jgi:hypothetical protein
MTYTDEHASRLGNYAGFVTRLIAWIIDHMVISGVFFIIGWIGSFVIDTFQFMGDTSSLVVLGLVVLFNFLFYIFSSFILLDYGCYQGKHWANILWDYVSFVQMGSV